jgi:hypothetical protein
VILPAAFLEVTGLARSATSILAVTRTEVNWTLVRYFLVRAYGGAPNRIRPRSYFAVGKIR